MSFVSELAPRPLWKHFDGILAIPRPSKREERACRYVIDLAERRGYRWRQDAAGNLVVEKPASPGREGAPGVVLQGHLDMVTEKNAGTVHDFDRDPIVPRRDGGWVKATGTTLGADNGIGAAAMLAVLEADDLVHGPLELLFTVDEETGLTGVLALDAAAIALRGRLLLNLDSEEEGAVTLGCAGGAAAILNLPLESAPPPAGYVALEVKLSGLKGGHSGMEIHLQRGNALPREASARVLIAAGRRGPFTAAVARETAAIRAEIRTADPDLKIEITDSELPKLAWTAEVSRRVLDLLNALPHGVLAMSNDIPGLVETSVNLATATVSGNSGNDLTLLLSLRSSVDSAMRDTKRRLRAFAELSGADFTEIEGYSGWKPDLASPLLATFRKVHEKATGHDPELKAVHAGLECGVLGEKFPGMDMISFGPVIEGAHSPDERVDVASVARFWELLKAVLAELAGAN